MSPASPCAGVAQVGWDMHHIVPGTLAEAVNFELRAPVHSLISVMGNLHEVEAEFWTSIEPCMGSRKYGLGLGRPQEKACSHIPPLHGVWSLEFITVFS